MLVGGGAAVAAAIIAPATTRHLRLTLKPFAYLSLYYYVTPNTLFHRLDYSPLPFSTRRRSFCTAATLHSEEGLRLHHKVGEFRKKLKVVDIKGGPSQGLDMLGNTLFLNGWVRTLRLQRSVTFIEINDGSCLSNMQCVMDSEAAGFDQVESGLITTGASIWVQGVVVESKGSKQKVELKVNKIVLVGKSDPSFPIQKKRASREFLRTKAHLRARTNTFSAVWNQSEITSMEVMLVLLQVFLTSRSSRLQG